MAIWKYLCLALVLSCNPAVGATNFYAHINPSQTSVFLGEVFNIDVIVKTVEKPATPDLNALSDFHAIVLDAGRATSETNTWLYRFAFRAKRRAN